MLFSSCFSVSWLSGSTNKPTQMLSCPCSLRQIRTYNRWSSHTGVSSCQEASLGVCAVHSSFIMQNIMWEGLVRKYWKMWFRNTFSIRLCQTSYLKLMNDCYQVKWRYSDYLFYHGRGAVWVTKLMCKTQKNVQAWPLENWVRASAKPQPLSALLSI